MNKIALIVLSILFQTVVLFGSFQSNHAHAQGDDAIRKKCRALYRAELGLPKGADGKEARMPKDSFRVIDKCVANGGKL